MYNHSNKYIKTDKLFWIRFIWTELHTYGEEFFKFKGDNNKQDHQYLKLYQIQLHPNIDIIF